MKMSILDILPKTLDSLNREIWTGAHYPCTSDHILNMLEYTRRSRYKFFDFLRNLNLFASAPPSTDAANLRNERISTRLFILLLTVLMSILIGYTSLVTITKTASIDAPSLTSYRNLYSRYSQTLTCPCKRVSITYEQFLQVSYTLHDVCSSIFVDDSWIEYLARHRKNAISTLDGFQSLGIYIFQALKTFCQACNKSISDSLMRFVANKYVSPNAVAEQLMQSQSKSLMEQFISSTLNDFLLSLQIIRDTTQVNALVSALQTNYFLIYYADYKYLMLFPLKDASNHGCDLSASFVRQLVIYNDSGSNILFNVTGFFTGCYIVEGILKSTLQCLYNETCVNMLQSFISSPSMNVVSMDTPSSSRFQQNSTVETLVNQLMVEKWHLSSVYEDYYNQCQPTKCIYTYVGRNGITYIVATVFGLIGGLVAILRVLIPRLVKFTPRLINSTGRCLRISRLENGKIEQTTE